MSASDYLEGKVLDDLFGIAAFTPPANLYVGLFTAAPTDAGGGTAVSGNAYARIQVAATGTNWLRTVSTISNKNIITFATPTPAGWGTVTHWGLYDALTAGNLILWGALNQQIQTQAGSALSFAVGALTSTLD